ncbi:4Fe-4S dicluster domain-containing protein [Thermodesulfobacteriota bacterium]
MQLGFYFDQSRCIGCYACVAACRSWNEQGPEGPDLIRLVSWEEGDFPEVSLTHLVLTCYHCARPACIDACPEGIIEKRATDGAVIITDADKCTSCLVCQDVCPYDAPQFDGNGSPAMLCSLCTDRLALGKKPSCVASCPVEALDVGPLEELAEHIKGVKEVAGFSDPVVTEPSIIFKAKE